jgi:hypothetical protein
MQLHLNFLRWSADFRAILSKDGWVLLAGEKKDELDATHPQVGDEDAARTRLHRLGLLTSRSLRIEFRQHHKTGVTDKKNSGMRLEPGDN